MPDPWSAWNDPSDLPDWFLDDESKHYRPQLPIPPALIAKIKEQQQALSVRPIAKVAEARARKNKRAKLKLAAAKKNKNPRTIKDEQAVLEKCEPHSKKMSNRYKKGDRIKIVRGSYQGQNATFQEYRGKSNMSVRVALEGFPPTFHLEKFR